MTEASLLSLKEAAEICGLNVRTLLRECTKGSIDGAVQVGRQWCVPAEWAEAHRLSDYSATHIPLAEAARIAGISRQGMIDRIKCGAISGFATQAIFQRQHWLVERDSLARWIAEREKKKS